MVGHLGRKDIPLLESQVVTAKQVGSLLVPVRSLPTIDPEEPYPFQVGTITGIVETPEAPPEVIEPGLIPDDGGFDPFDPSTYPELEPVTVPVPTVEPVPLREPMIGDPFPRQIPITSPRPDLEILELPTVIPETTPFPQEAVPLTIPETESPFKPSTIPSPPVVREVPPQDPRRIEITRRLIEITTSQDLILQELEDV